MPDVLDQPTLAALLDSVGGDTEFMKELLDAYLQSTPGLFATMRKAAADGDGPGLQRAAHSLKTGSANIGALAFAAQCKELENIGKTGVLDGVETRIDEAAAAYEDVVSALQAQTAWLTREGD
jgi:HPt (histidine-containing phosphotransfer) domain-containing protein